jgi:hypothetical protein
MTRRPRGEVYLVDDPNEWNDRTQPSYRGVDEAVSVGLWSDDVQARDEDSQLVGWLPAVVLLALILLSPFVHDAFVAIAHIP